MEKVEEVKVAYLPEEDSKDHFKEPKRAQKDESEVERRQKQTFEEESDLKHGEDIIQSSSRELGNHEDDNLRTSTSPLNAEVPIQSPQNQPPEQNSLVFSEESKANNLVNHLPDSQNNQEESFISEGNNRVINFLKTRLSSSSSSDVNSKVDHTHEEFYDNLPNPIIEEYNIKEAKENFIATLQAEYEDLKQIIDADEMEDSLSEDIVGVLTCVQFSASSFNCKKVYKLLRRSSGFALILQHKDTQELILTTTLNQDEIGS